MPSLRPTGNPTAQVPNAYQHSVQELPNDVLLFLLASRYCEVDSELRDTAWSLFGTLPAGWPLVQAVCTFTHRHIRFDYMQARANRTALAVFSRAHRSLPRLHAPGHHILQVLEHTGAVLHRVPRRYQGAGGGVSHGFQRLV